MAKVIVAFVQDRSGSMAGVWQETLSGYKVFVDDLKKGEAANDTVLTLTAFDTLVETPVVMKPISELAGSELEKHGPRGGTALYDAVGKTIRDIEGSVGPTDKVIFVIVTDGHENSSREWTKDGLHAAIDAKLKTGTWTFTYLGTQPETWDGAQGIGITASNTRNYQAAQAPAAYASMARSVMCMSVSPELGNFNLSRFSDEQEERSAGMSRKNAAPPQQPTAADNRIRGWR